MYLTKHRATIFDEFSIGFVKSYLTSRTYRVKIDQIVSSEFKVQNGSNQGSKLGPILSIIYTSDLVEHLKSEISLYADDAKIYREINSFADQAILQSDLNMVYQLSLKWKMPINISKCYCMNLFSECESTYSVNGMDFTIVNKVKDLGITYSNDLKFNEYVIRQCKKANCLISVILKSFGRLSRKEFEHTIRIIRI